jgi:ubiquinone/menaquinone biosynthesis C-methylase UbiE
LTRTGDLPTFQIGNEMKTAQQIHLADVQKVYSGAEGRLWELIMGEQIHLGGLASSMDLAERAGIGAGQSGVDFCCATGAGMRFLVRFRKVERMKGIDATRAMLDLGRRRCAEEGLADRITFVEANVCSSGLASGNSDFVWGEDAWCYVEDKPRLIAEAARLVKPRGVIAFTDWMLGKTGMSEAEAERYLKFMKFPNVLSLPEYSALLKENGCAIQSAADTGRFAPSVALYLEMIEKQLTYDALKIIGFDTALAQAILAEMRFVHELARSGKIMQGLLVSRKQN